MKTSSFPGRNDPCPCGSGEKYKRCCLVPGVDSPQPTASLTAVKPKKEKFSKEDVPLPDDPNFVPWMKAMIQRLPKSERREFEKMLAPVLRVSEKAAASEARQMRAQEQLFKQIGCDPSEITDVSPEGVQRWVEKQMHDPGKRDAINAALAAHPEITDQTTKELNKFQDDFFDLLENDPDAPLLTIEEMEPWIRDLGEQLQQLEKPVQSSWWRRKPKPLSPKVAAKLFCDTTDRMAAEIFTPERVGQLRRELEVFAAILADDNEEDDSMTVRKGIMFLPSDDSPDSSKFLPRFAFLSMRVAFQEIEKAAQMDPGEHET